MGTGASVDDNTPDKHSGLTKRQKIAIRKMWKEVETNTQKHSVKIFLRFFEKYPGYRKYFVSQSGEEMTKVAEDAHIQSHFRAIVASISALIKSIISKPKTLDERLKYLAILHKDMGLSMKDFGNFRDVLVDYLKAEFPKEMTIFEITAWNMFLTTMFQRICTRMEEMNKPDQEGRMYTLPGPQQQKKTLLGKIFKRSNKKRQEEYWQQRKEYWRNQRELWSETKSGTSDEMDELQDGQKDVGSHISEAVSSLFSTVSMNLNPDAMAKEVASKSLAAPKEREKPANLSKYDIPMPEGGFVRRGSQAPRPNAGNMRPKSPSSHRYPPQPPTENTADGCLPCGSSARGRRRSSFNDTYQPSAPQT